MKIVDNWLFSSKNDQIHYIAKKKPLKPKKPRKTVA